MYNNLQRAENTTLDIVPYKALSVQVLYNELIVSAFLWRPMCIVYVPYVRRRNQVSWAGLPSIAITIVRARARGFLVVCSWGARVFSTVDNGKQVVSPSLMFALAMHCGDSTRKRQQKQNLLDKWCKITTTKFTWHFSSSICSGNRHLSKSFIENWMLYTYPYPNINNSTSVIHLTTTCFQYMCKMMNYVHWSNRQPKMELEQTTVNLLNVYFRVEIHLNKNDVSNWVNQTLDKHQREKKRRAWLKPLIQVSLWTLMCMQKRFRSSEKHTPHSTHNGKLKNDLPQ